MNNTQQVGQAAEATNVVVGKIEGISVVAPAVGVEVINDPVVITAEATTNEQVTEYFNGLLQTENEALKAGALADNARGREFGFKTDMQIIAYGARLRDEAAGDAKALQAARKVFKTFTKGFNDGLSKKIMSVQFPSSRGELYSTARFNEFVSHMIENKSGIGSTYRALYEGKTAPSLPESGEGDGETSKGKEEAKEGLVLADDNAIVMWAVETFGKDATPQQGVINALTAIKALIGGSLKIEQVQAKYGQA